MSSLINDLHAEDVAEYLNHNRQFFHVFPSLLGELSIPHPKTGEEISLLERQVHQLRQQRDQLQTEVDTLKDVVGENGQLLHKVYAMAYRLLAAQTNDAAVAEIYQTMDRVFEVEAMTLVTWEMPSESVPGLHQLGLSQQWSQSLKNALEPGEPRCGFLEPGWQDGLFQTQAAMQTVCVMPLGEQRVWGALALGASSDRFHPDLGTYFLTVMGQMISARLARLFDA
ncbi:DUF484 family protein [Thiomicrospira sp. WB1]|uniref:DUF484 family protein n=1 Tax=Thiomicrospira sp. WB1 TaxID=1685380 RepID=UPI00074A2AF7|nr:DUF484 family protein [Thiomicrospira sp. WB1]KUJ73060.1 hypothetical protein AVO41_02475 [Thiomicrospira sp. WB1]